MRFLIISLFVFCTISYSAKAEDIIPKPLKVMPSIIKPVQSDDNELSKAAPENSPITHDTDISHLDSLSPRPADGFSPEFWTGATREDIVNFLSKPYSITNNVSTRHISLRATITPTPSIPMVKEDDENIYALRLNRLLDMGAIDDAQTLYKLNENAPPSPLAARAGIESTIGSGNIAVACLDQKAMEENLKKQTLEFWNHIDIFCQALLSPASGDDDNLRLANASRAYLEIVKPTLSTPDDLNKLDVMTTIALLKTNRLDSIISTPDNLKKINDKHLALIVRFYPPIETILPLLAEALNRGIFNPEKALEKLKAVFAVNQLSKKSSNAPNTPSIYKEFLEEYFKTPDTPMVTDKLLELTDTPIKELLLIPLYTAPEIAFPESHKRLSLRLLALTNQDLPANLVYSAYNSGELPKDNAESGELMLIKALMVKAESIEKNEPNLTNSTLMALNYANYPQKEIKNAYDNIFSLTPVGNYVMHSHDTLSSLKESADKKQMYQVVIRSLAIIDDKPLEKLHPAELYRILEALNSAGLNEETIFLTREVLGNIIKK